MAEQKFGHLPLGQRFSWRGRIWQKTSPLLACAEGDDQPRIIPRSASVVPADTGTADGSRTDGEDPVSLALLRVRQECLEKMELLQLPQDQFEAIRTILIQATENTASGHSVQ
ncbi:hypothetical protein [Thiolapillus sp.]|uniref:hypothetical protein n=1 Tax=Thiolapillus sp. TaxID=2017437 RepID=UPI003AF66458